MKKQNQSPAPDEIRDLPYVDLLALMGESNLPPGGFAGIRRLIRYNHIHASSQVLHIGSSAGYLARELSRLTGCDVRGIDISQKMVDSANSRALAEGLQKKCVYECADVRTYHSKRKFDVVLTGGALAFVEGHNKAVKAMVAATKPYGFVTICELAYHTPPSDELRQKVTGIIGVEVPEYKQDYWLKLMEHPELLRWKTIIKPESVPRDDEVVAYCRKMAHWVGKDWSNDSLIALESRLKDIFLLFAANNRHLSSVFVASRKIPPEAEPMLFI